MTWLLGWLGFVAAGCAILLPLYGRFLTSLQRHHPEHFASLGSPTLFMASPSRSLKLQRFLYSGATRPEMHSSVRRLAHWLRLLTPVFVVLVFVLFYYGYLASIRSLF